MKSDCTPMRVGDPATERRPERDAQRGGGTDQAHGKAQVAARHAVGQLGQHHAGVAEVEAGQRRDQEDRADRARDPERGEQQRLDDRAADDDRLAAVAVGPGAPERDERQADQQRQRSRGGRPWSRPGRAETPSCWTSSGRKAKKWPKPTVSKKLTIDEDRGQPAPVGLPRLERFLDVERPMVRPRDRPPAQRRRATTRDRSACAPWPSRSRGPCPARRCAGTRPRPPRTGPFAGGPTRARGGRPRSCRRET